MEKGTRTAPFSRACASFDGFGELFVALSYRWLSAGCPDPDAFHLGIVAEVARLYLENLKEFFEALGLGEADFALFCAAPRSNSCEPPAPAPPCTLRQGTSDRFTNRSARRRRQCCSRTG